MTGCLFVAVLRCKARATSPTREGFKKLLQGIKFDLKIEVKGEIAEKKKDIWLIVAK